MKKWLKQVFTWWHSAGLTTMIYTRMFGKPVGKDELANRYYENRDGKRWVIFDDEIEASRIPPAWRAWLQYNLPHPPEDAPERDWQKPHQPNMTGTTGAYHPPGSLLAARRSRNLDASVEAWKPD